MRLQSLTEKQEFVLNQLSEGRTTKEIAAITHVSEQTIREHIQAVIKKFEAKNITHCVKIYTEAKLLSQISKNALGASNLETAIEELELGPIANAVAEQNSEKYFETMQAIVKALKK